MRHALARPILLLLVILAASTASLRAVVLYTYDFSTGSGAAVSQSSGQPFGATFGDFTRTNLNAASNGAVFASTNWDTGGSLNPAEYLSYSITASPGLQLA